MGLKWYPDNRSKPGHEAEFARIWAMDLSRLERGRRARVNARYREISESPYDFAEAEGESRKLEFPAEALKEALDVIGDHLLDRAWERQTGQELSAYSHELHTAAAAFARTHHLDWRDDETTVSPAAADSEQDDAAEACRIVFLAALWCRWWSVRGFGLFPDY